MSENHEEALFHLSSPEASDPTREDVSGAPREPEDSEGEHESGGLLDERELKAVLEALLYVSPAPVPLERLAAALDEAPKAAIVRALAELQETCEREQRGLQLVQIAGGWRFVTRPEHASWIKRLDKARVAPKLSRSALESLAIIAYKQPIVRAEIEQIRGVETSGVLRTLLERKLVRIVGRKEMPGRPIMYGTTKFFLEHFGLNDLAELPPLREFKELGESEQVLLPVEERPVDEPVEEPILEQA
jgi:segregation and condensation protein B